MTGVEILDISPGPSTMEGSVVRVVLIRIVFQRLGLRGQVGECMDG